MSTINDLLSLITAGIAGNAAIGTWASSNYGTTVSVSEYCDPRDEPGPENCPLVVVTAESKTAGLSPEPKRHIFQTSCIVYDDESETTATGVTRYLGCSRAEALRVLALNAIVESLPDDHHLEEIDVEYMSLEEYPLVAVLMTLNITQEKLIGYNPFE